MPGYKANMMKNSQVYFWLVWQIVKKLKIKLEEKNHVWLWLPGIKAF